MGLWYDKGPLLSHNKMLNMVLSGRGTGKTFHYTDWSVDDFLKTKNETIWVRRYAVELTNKQAGGNPGILDNDAFYKALINEGKYPGVKFEIQGTTLFINDEPAVHFVALSTSRGMKSINFPKVNKIIFDEFIIDKGRTTYLKNEVEIFLDLVETVARMRDNVRVVLLANAITQVNPYFIYFKLRPDPEKRFTVKGQVCVELYTNEEFVAKKNKTRFAQLVNGTRYGDYAINNKWLLDTDTFIEKKTAEAEFCLGMKYNGVMYGFWVDYKRGLMYANKQYDPSSYCLYCLTKDDHEANLLLIKSIAESKRVQRIVFAFQNGLLRFSDQVVKSQVYEFIGFFVR